MGRQYYSSVLIGVAGGLHGRYFLFWRHLFGGEQFKILVQIQRTGGRRNSFLSAATANRERYTTLHCTIAQRHNILYEYIILVALKNWPNILFILQLGGSIWLRIFLLGRNTWFGRKR